MQNKTVVLMAIALMRGEPFVKETRKSRWRASGDDRKRETTLDVAVRSNAQGGSIMLIDDTIYDSYAWTTQMRLVRHEKKPDRLLILCVPEFTHNSFGLEVNAASQETGVPVVHVRPDLAPDAARAYFDFAIWQTVRAAARNADPELTQNALLKRAHQMAKERSLYALFFGLRWPPVVRDAPDDLDALTSTITRKRVEGPKKELSEWRKESARELGNITPFWLTPGGKKL